MQEENIFTRIAGADTPTVKKAQSFIAANGFSKAKNPKELALKLASYYRKKGDEAVSDIIELHPDKDYFEAFYTKDIEDKINQKVNEKLAEKNNSKFDEDCGCGGSKYSNDGGGNSPAAAYMQQARKTADDFLPYFSAIVVVGLLGVTMVVIGRNS